MKIYTTALSWEFLADNFNILRGYRLIDIDSLLKVSGLNMNKEVHQFVMNQEIATILKKFARYSSKSCKGIIYKNTLMTKETIKNLKELEYVEKVICIDSIDCPLKKDIYDACDEIVLI
jgi:hypothetical protein